MSGPHRDRSAITERTSCDRARTACPHVPKCSAGLFRRAGHGPDRSLHRRRGHARRHRRRDDARAAGASRRVAMALVPAPSEAAALAAGRRAAPRIAGDVGDRRIRAASTSRRSSRSIAAASTIIREDGVDRKSRHRRTGRRTAMPLLVQLELPAGHDRRGGAGSKSPTRARRPRPTRRSCASAGCSIATACSTTRRLRMPGDARRAEAVPRVPRGRARRRRTAASATRSATSTRASRRPPPT